MVCELSDPLLLEEAAMSTKEVTRRALQLYKEIFVLHRIKLPPAMKALGDMYLRKEFKTHMYRGNCSRTQFEQFINAWKSYAEMIRSQESVTGKPLSAEQRRLLNDSQRGQLEELEKATSELVSPKK
jgi:hypothetical protein